jgi:eukaryotic-like serine/threonine-protein kinase
VFVASKDGHLYALALDDGKELWQSASMRTITAAPLAGDSIVCIQTHYGETHAFDIKTGKELWAANLGGSLQSTPIVTPEAVYLATYQGVVYALR